MAAAFPLLPRTLPLTGFPALICAQTRPWMIRATCSFMPTTQDHPNDLAGEVLSRLGRFDVLRPFDFVSGAAASMTACLSSRSASEKFINI